MPKQLPKQESDIVEVLWKQDVDLGYSLTPYTAASDAEDAANATNKAAAAIVANQSAEEKEKLCALEELKVNRQRCKHENTILTIIVSIIPKQQHHQKSADKDNSGSDSDNGDSILDDDEWAGIQFTIDSETGTCQY